jgi:hypothetical protein
VLFTLTYPWLGFRIGVVVTPKVARGGRAAAASVLAATADG